MKPAVEKVKSIFGRHVGYRASFGDISTGNHKTQGEALEELEQMLLRIANSDDSPCIVERNGTAILVARTTNGWGHRIICDDERPLTSGDVSLGGGNEWSRKQAISDAEYHLAQITWHHGEKMPECVPEKRRRDFQSWMDFQNRYAEARAKGMPDQDAHDFAGRNPVRAELWATSK